MFRIRNLGIGAIALVMIVLVACSADGTPASPTALAAARGTDRPFAGSCAVTVTPRLHEEGEEGGCDGGHEDESGGPPIPRHLDVAGTCQVTHLGRATLSGRLNLSGPLGGGHGGESATDNEDGHGQLMARGRLLFTAANGDQLAGRYIPVSAAFAATGDGGTLSFTATERFGESCSSEGGEGGAHVAAPDHEEPVSTGRFADALGTAGITGTLRIGSTGQGSGRFVFADGLLGY